LEAVALAVLVALKRVQQVEVLYYWRHHQVLLPAI
jgi:hypothetical protein